jgi:serine protease
MKMKLLGAAIVTVGLVGVTLPQLVPAQLVPAQPASPAHRVIVKWSTQGVSVGARSAAALLALSAAEQRAGVSARSLRMLATGGEVLQFDQALTATKLSDFMAELRKSGQVEYAEADVLLKGAANVNDVEYSNQWALNDPVSGIYLPAAWDRTRGAGVIVAVVDSGYLPHADLTANSLVEGYDFISDADLANDGDGRDADEQDPGDADPSLPGCEVSSWHGTRVAGTIAAVTDNYIGVAGVAHGARVLPVRALGRCNTGFMSDVADAIVWSAGGTVTGAPTNANPANVINLSLGGPSPCSATMQAAVSFAEVHGVVVVAAAGNGNMPVAEHTPANCSGVVSVVALNRDATRREDSNFGDAYRDAYIAAPGESLSTSNSGATTPDFDSYQTYAGTSAAAAHVSGVAALVAARMPPFRQAEIKTILAATAREFPAVCLPKCGAGIVDAAAAVALADQAPPAPEGFIASDDVSTTGTYFVSWQAPPLATHYLLQRSQDSVWGPVVTFTATAVAFQNTPPGDYLHRVQACNDRGCSAAVEGAAVKVINRALIPPRPAPITAAPDPSFTGDYAVQWSQTLRATSYVLARRLGGSNWQEFPLSETSLRFDNLASGDWQNRVKACNFHGCSDWTSSVTVTVFRAPPPRPSGVVATPSITYERRHSVSWSAVTGAISYVAEHGMQNGTGAVEWISATVNGTSKTWTSLPVGRHYYRVKACNPNGCSDYKPAMSVTAAAPLPPSSISASPSTTFTGNYTVSWPAAQHAHHYILQRAHPTIWGADVEVSGTARAFSNQGAGSYRHRIKSCNAADECGGWITGALVTVCTGQCQ